MGNQFNVSPHECNGKICLGTDDAKLAEKLKFERTDKYYYEKWVPIEDVKITVKRKDIQH